MQKSLIPAVIFLLFACGSSENKSEVNSQMSGNAQQTTNQSATQSATESNMTIQNSSNSPATSIPEFTFYILTSGIGFTKSDLPKSGTHVFIMFDPSCSYCQHEARDIGANFDQFPDAHFYFVSMNDPALMATFFDRFAPELNGKENVHMLYDRNMEFVSKFHIPTQYPATYVYQNNGLFKTYWNGAKSVGEIVSAINN